MKSDNRPAEAARVRLAATDDAAAITRTLRGGLDAELLSFTIFSADGVEEFVRDTVAQAGPLAGTLYTVAAAPGAVAGFTEFRRSADELFLNHIYLDAEWRGSGVGRRLLRESIELVRDAGQRRIALDVFDGNRRARGWYESLGFSERSRSVWIEAALPAAGGARGHADGLAMAELAMERYGFCSFQLTTALRSYTIGRIGAGLFRSTGSEVLADGDALALLASIAPRARLLCIVEPSVEPDRFPFAARVVGTSCRLAAEVEGVRAALGRP